MYFFEEFVKTAEALWTEQDLGILDPVKWRVTIHRGDKGKRAGSTDEHVAMREQTKVLAGIAIGEANAVRS